MKNNNKRQNKNKRYRDNSCRLYDVQKEEERG